MKSIAYLSLIIALFICNTGFSQNLPTNYKIPKKPNYNQLEIGIGTGLTALYGDLGRRNTLRSFTSFRPMYRIGMGYAMGNHFKIKGNMAYALMGQTDRSLNKFYSILAEIKQANISLELHLNANNEKLFSPYIGVGIGYMEFNTKADLSNEQGQVYHRWTDGSIRNIGEFDENGLKSKEAELKSERITRDFKYETEVNKGFNDNATYNKSSYILQMEMGFTMRVNASLALNFFTSYNATATDYIDNYKDGGNDNYLLTGLGLNVYLGRKNFDGKNNRYQDVNFGKLETDDTDLDGIPDFDDACAGTPSGYIVDNNGCPMDYDKDGVPYFRDIDRNTPFGVPVDQYGKAISEKEMENSHLKREGEYMERQEYLNLPEDNQELELKNEPTPAFF